jgi:hypothetical protein
MFGLKESHGQNPFFCSEFKFMSFSMKLAWLFLLDFMFVLKLERRKKIWWLSGIL